MRWPDDAGGWPLTEYSRFVLSRPHRWHVQESGQGPTLILLHGAGGATQSWRALLPLLARSHHVIAIDLPGQGFTQLGARQRCGLDPMAQDLMALAVQEGWSPDALIGHSAGAALALRIAELSQTPPPVIGINAALGHFKGVAGWLFPMMARALALAPFTADLFSATAASGQNVRKLIEGTGSVLPPDGLAFYQRLVADRDHVDATLAMMAQWSLDGLLARLPDFAARTLLIAAEGDRAVPPQTSATAAARMPDARLERIARLGHLAHEEDADQIYRVMMAFLATSNA